MSKGCKGRRHKKPRRQGRAGAVWEYCGGHRMARTGKRTALVVVIFSATIEFLAINALHYPLRDTFFVVFHVLLDK